MTKRKKNDLIVIGTKINNIVDSEASDETKKLMLSKIHPNNERERKLIKVMIEILDEGKEVSAVNVFMATGDQKLLAFYMELLNQADKEKHNG